ncbi:TPA: hypothetical protein DEP30_02295 [Candidatus Nomurabacteria bacterium]|nr:MAG: hypothetical protein UR97_C0003G0033 [Candidatus Nomurabacteria bacterium GW2011_GWE2_36_115]KKP94099.1 MAG: hypothetical protein US00_C0003G0023 [Candidatus Nomurabacteria bacterium GW2011_GWF2_36_126]KKP96773.1 MAG: hypothetical protein US04_C0001G0275 [Candidatus Nomurabacteria bacterium GW2011_GWD2_36_14]KKP99623.1 MAG: hypothetical protein US08_C0001G0306 [Candidatus Nomurabacteria bacterium GW2011_GWF2_36_19]KKQ05461.1 MAG: hypothetical protein US17_C0004G0033 [Candidatus Nomuraba
MKKIQIICLIVFCFLSFSIARAETLIIKSVDKRIEDIEKSREKLQKDIENNYKQVQAELKSLSARIDTNIKSEFYCVLPTQTCTESIYQGIRGTAISSGLIPDAGQLAQCRAKIDEYNTKLQEYNKCFQDWQNKKIGDSAQKEYDYQLQVYELKSQLACMDKEGHYSSFNKITKQCECVEGSTFVNGKCINRIDNLLMCVKTFGPLSHYDYDKAGCVCDEGSKLDLEKDLCVAETEKVVPPPVKEKSPYKNKFQEILQQKETEQPLKPSQGLKESPKSIITVVEEKVPSQAEITPNTSHDIQPPAITGPSNVTFWQKIKKNFLKIKFW